MGKTKYLFLIFFGLLTIFFWSPKAEAETLSAIVFTEIAYNPQDTDENHQWVEILNLSGAVVDIADWKFNDGSNHLFHIPDGQSSILISPNEYLILAENSEAFLADYPDHSGQVVDSVMSLNNTSDTISLINDLGLTEDEVTYDKTWGGYDNGKTLEKINPAGANDSDNWQESYILSGTPGESASEIVLPNYPLEVLGQVSIENAIIHQVQVTSVVDGDTIKVSGLTGFPSVVRLLAVDCQETGQALFGPASDFTKSLLGKTVDLVISVEPDEQLDDFERTLGVVIFNDQVFNTQLLSRGLASFYDTTNAILKNDVWQEFEEKAQTKKIGLWASNQNPSVVLSEILPDPEGTDSEGEWVEIYNPLNHTVDLSYFLLEDYLIPYGTLIPAGSWLVFPRSQTDIALNNSGGEIQLFFPDELLLDEVSYGQADSGWAWALFGSSWAWTMEPTPNSSNIFLEEIENKNENDNENTTADIPINSDPIDIKTGDFRNYEDYLVKITGEVTETSGNTFYLDDGTGEAKVYIQSSKDIDKPPMHVGDIFEIVGIVNFYRNSWRILPQKQDDIKLILALQKADTQSTTSTKKTTTKASSASVKSAVSTAKARSPTNSSGQVASANDVNTQVKSAQTPFWIQMIKVVTSLAIVFLILLIIKIREIKKTKPEPLGGHFGDDFT